MLSKIESLSSNVLNIIIYYDSPSVQYFVRGILKDKFKMHKDFILTINTAKELNEAKLNSFVPPLLCDKWLMHVDADKLSKKDLASGVSKVTPSGVTVYWTTTYRTYKYLLSLDSVKKQGSYCTSYRLTKGNYTDIRYIYNKVLEGSRYKDSLSKELFNYVATSYNYDLESVFKLFRSIRSGNEFNTRREIIEEVGAGGNSVDTFTLTLLRTSANTEKGKKQGVAKALKLLADLNVTYKFSTIRNFMLNTVNGLIDIKQLQIMGYYRKINPIIPESFDTKRLGRLKRFDYVVINDITLPRLLNLKLCLLHYDDFNTEIALIQTICAYYDSLKSNGDKPKRFKGRKVKKRK